MQTPRSSGSHPSASPERERWREGTPNMGSRRCSVEFFLRYGLSKKGMPSLQTPAGCHQSRVLWASGSYRLRLGEPRLFIDSWWWWNDRRCILVREYMGKALVCQREVHNESWESQSTPSPRGFMVSGIYDSFTISATYNVWTFSLKSAIL